MKTIPMPFSSADASEKGQGVGLGTGGALLALLGTLLLTACQDDATPTPTGTPTPAGSDAAMLCDPDWDGDSYLANQVACVDASGTLRPPAVPLATEDCQIYDASFHPGAEERYDGKDNDCNGQIDDDTAYTDDDGDGFSELAGDCDDYLANIYPGQVELPGDLVDSNCDGYDGKLPPDADIGDPETYEGTVLERASAVLIGPGDRANLMGWSSQVGDLDSDGTSDLVWAAAYGDRDSLQTQGVVYVTYVPPEGLSGVLEFESAASFSVVGLGAPNSLGITIRSGDINGDGMTDLLLGDHLQRAIYVFFGGERRSGQHSVADADLSFHGVGDESAPIGHVFDMVGDLDQDGYDDLVIGQPDYHYSRGRAYVLYGRAVWDAHVSLGQADAVLEGQQNLELGGMVVKGLGDLDEDGYPELAIISAWEVQAEIEDYPDYLQHPSGAVHLYYGGATRLVSGRFRDTAQAHLVADEDSPQLLGMTLTAADLDLDGHRDVILGLPIQSAGVWYGSGVRLNQDLPFHAVIGTYYGLEPSGLSFSIGEYIAVADVMDDEKPELIMSANVRVASNMLSPGLVSTFWGSSERPATRYNTQTPETASTLYGAFGLLELVFQVSAAGDLTGDGRPDLLVSTQLYPYQQARCALMVFSGGNIR